MKTIHVLNGPNLNLLGQREPAIYGHQTLADIETLCRKAAGDTHDVRFRQSNWEGQIVDWIHEARGSACGIVINPAALTHSSIAILDALTAFDGPVIEVHLSQVHRREAFRHHSYVSQRADGVIAGLGPQGYAAAIRHIVALTGD